MPRDTRKRTREAAEVRRARIIDEAIRTIGERGYYGFTVQDLAQRCKLSNAGLLHHFPSKQHLLLAAVEEIERREADALTPVVEAAARKYGNMRESPRAIVEFLREMHQYLVREPEIARVIAVLQLESLDPTHPAHRSVGRRDARVRAFFTEMIEPYAQNPQEAATQLLAMHLGLTILWLSANQTFNSADVWTRSVKLLVPALTRRQAKRRKTVSKPAGAKKRKPR